MSYISGAFRELNITQQSKQETMIEVKCFSRRNLGDDVIDGEIGLNSFLKLLKELWSLS